jgi:general secretion pathway protein D
MLLSLQKNKILHAMVALLLFVSPYSFANEETSCKYRVFDIKINESVSLREVVNQLLDLCNISAIVKDAQAASMLETSLQGININEMTLYEIFDLLLEENNLIYELNQNTLKISALKTKTFVLDYITSVRQGTATLNASVSATPVEEGTSRDLSGATDNEIRVVEEFNFWETLDTEISAILNNGAEEYTAQAPIINHKAGLITITGTTTQLARIATYLENLKQRLLKQVMIDVSVFSVSLQEGQNTGIDWSKFQLGINQDRNGNAMSSSTATMQNTYSDLGNSFSKNINIVNNLVFSMEGLLDFLKSNGETKVISSPKVITMNNQQALITVGDNINYRTKEETFNSDGDRTGETYNNYSIFIGVLLNLLPEISDENTIMLRINPSISSFKYSEDDAKQTAPREVAPDTTEKKLSTVTMVNSGDTIILGGLIESSKGLSQTKVPLLGDIPLLGQAFQSTKDTSVTTELVFVITPRIVGEAPSHIQTLKALGFSEHVSR